jgi:predicted ABC-type transport system involved in lysophospholipase L1 biosynthesis ATPase subunit
MNAVPLARVGDVTVVFGQGEAKVTALDDIDLVIDPHDSLALIGRSGSGKTTLLHVLGGLVDVASGTVEFLGEPLSTLDAAARARARARGIAYVFQGANLLPHFTAFENVAFAAHVSGGEIDPSVAPLELLRLVGLAGKEDNLPSELSGGEAQRVALARALAQNPNLLLCDEPTGHLDSDTAERVLDLIFALQRRYEFALVIATHDVDVAARLPEVVELHDGRIVDGPGEA